MRNGIFKLNTHGLIMTMFFSWLGIMIVTLIVNEFFYGSEIEMERPKPIETIKHNIERDSEYQVIEVEVEGWK